MALDWLPDTFLQWVSVITIAGFGVLAALNIFDRVAKSRRNDADRVEERLVSALKDEVDVLTRKIDGYDERMVHMNDKITSLQAENGLMRDLLKGTDKDSQAYRAQALASMKLAEQTHQIVLKNQTSIMQLYGAINDHLKAEGKIIKEIV